MPWVKQIPPIPFGHDPHFTVVERHLEHNAAKHFDVDFGYRLICNADEYLVVDSTHLMFVWSYPWFDTPEAAKLAWELDRESRWIDKYRKVL